MEADKIKEELIKRSLAKKEFLHYLKYTFPGFENTAYQGRPEDKIHNKIVDALQRVESGECKRLMIFCPPRLGKSMISSQYFASRYLARDPSRKIIQASYGADLSNDFGRKTKRIVESNKFKKVFPDFELSKDKREGGKWETSLGGGYYSVGVGGATTGKGADLLIIDDPVKDRIEADSATIQERNVDWFDSVASTRLQSQDSAIILIMTRWNIYDLGGYIDNEEGEDWDHVVIQAIDDRGNEIIRPGKRDKGYMNRVKAKMLPKNRAALYQQDPIAATDGIFKRSYFDYFRLSDFEREDAVLRKSDLRCGIFIDPAFSSSAKSDDAVVGCVGQHLISKHLYLTDGFAETAAPSRTIANVISIYNKAKVDGFRVDFICCEDVKINKEQTKFIEDLRAALVENDIRVPLRLYSPKTKKIDRIKYNLEPIFSQKGFKFRSDMPDPNFNRIMEKQILEFPNGKHDDIIDMLAQAKHVFGGGETAKKEDRHNQRETPSLLTRQTQNQRQSPRGRRSLLGR